MKKVFETAKQIGARRSVQLDMVRAILHKFQFPFHSHEGGYLSCIELFQHIFRASFEGSGFTHKLESCTKSTIKGMNGKPKSKGSRINTNSGPATASNGHAVRGLEVAVNRYGVHNSTRSTLKMSLRSSPVLIALRQHSTGTGCSTNVMSKLSDLHNRSKSFPNQPIDRDLYKTFVLNKDMYLVAYNRLKSKPGMMTPGISPRTLDGMSSEVIDKLITQLSSESFSFSPGRRTQIDKASVGKRPLTIGDPQEKLVQEVIRLVLEAIYEPIFKKNSFGFRPKRGCHTALRYVFTKFKGCAWWIEGDIQGCFDNIPHDKLMVLLSSKIKDQRFLQLIRKALNAGYMIDKQPIYDIVGTPQGSIVSPILANIFLHQLDQYIEDLKADFDIIGNRKRNPIVRKLQWEMTQAKRSGDSKLIRQIAVKMRSNPNKLIESGNRKLMYVRYADDWIIAVNGRYSDASDILSKVTLLLKNLGLTVSPTKTKITNTYKEPALFLGTNIAHSQSVTYSLHKRGTLQRNSGFLVLSAPMKRIYKKLQEAGFMSNHRGVTRVTWLSLETRQIINLANSIVRGYENYYSFALNKGQLCTYVYFILRDAVLITLAHKLSLKTRAQVIKKFGPSIALYDQNNRDENNKPTLSIKLHKPSYRINLWDFKGSHVNTNIKALYATGLSLANLDKLNCSLCLLPPLLMRSGHKLRCLLPSGLYCAAGCWLLAGLCIAPPAACRLQLHTVAKSKG
jgi:group II intron reverse transcriptase/maturase